MAGVYCIFRNGTQERLDAVAERLRFGGESESRGVGSVAYLWMGHDDPARFAPATDPASGVAVVAGGRVCWPPSELRRAAELPYVGGTANRILLHRYLVGGAAAVWPYAGAAVVLVVDPRSRQVHLWTDQFGYHPAFLYRADDEAAVFTTFPDALHADPAVRVERDDVSTAEFLRAWRVTPPFTYDKHVLHAGAAAHHVWNLDDFRHVRETTWEPFVEPPFPSVDAAAEELAHAVRTAIHERTAYGDACTFFVSGGADSRALLYAAHDPAKIAGVNLYERPTFESQTAKTLCERAGARYVGFQRDREYYPRLATEIAKWSGAMWCIEDGHYVGTRPTVYESPPGLLMTACTVDWLFKGYGLEKNYRTLFGKALPFKYLLDERVDGFLPNYPTPPPPKYARVVDERLAAWFAGTSTTLKSARDRLAVEDRRIRPTAYTVSVSGPIMYRIFPYDTFLADPRVASCYSRILPEWKVNGDVWGRAVARICARAGDVVDSNYGWRVDASPTSRFVAFATGWAGRKWRKFANPPPKETAEHAPSYASWPDMGWYAVHSGVLRDFWESTPIEDRDRLADAAGFDPFGTPLAEWRPQAHALFRFVTLLAHWRTLRSGL